MEKFNRQKTEDQRQTNKQTDRQSATDNTGNTEACASNNPPEYPQYVIQEPEQNACLFENN